MCFGNVVSTIPGHLQDVSASPSRVVESVGSFDECKAFWIEKDMEEKKKRESVASSVSIEEYPEGGFENSAFIGVDRIDLTTHTSASPIVSTFVSMDLSSEGPRASISGSEEKPGSQRTPSPYEIERTKEAIFLDTDDPEPEEEYDEDDIDQETRVVIDAQSKVQPPQSPFFDEGEESSLEHKVIPPSSLDTTHSSLPRNTQVKEHSTRQVIEFEEQRTVREEITDFGGTTKEVKTTSETIVKTTTLEKSEFETSEKFPETSTSFAWEKASSSPQPQPSDTYEDEEQLARVTASSLVSEIEEQVEEKLALENANQGGSDRYATSSTSFSQGDRFQDMRSGSRPATTITTTTTTTTTVCTKASAPSSVDITDEELLSTGDISSPELLKHHQASTSTERRDWSQVPGAGDSTGAGTPEACQTIGSSSSGEFYTAREDGTVRSSSDDPTRPKSWDSSLLGQVSTNFPTSGSSGALEYQTALSAASADSSESYLGSLSSDASGSETLVASQIDLGRELLQVDEDEDDDEEIRGATTLEHSHHSEVSAEVAGSAEGETSGVPLSRSVHCEALHEEINRTVAGLPVTLTSSSSGTTVCTQVETTYEARVRGDPEIADDQEGNILVLEPLNQSSTTTRPVRTHRRAESQSWNESLLYGIEEKIEDEQTRDIIFPVEDADEISDLFLQHHSEELDDPIERPTTPEPRFSPQGDEPKKCIVYYPGSSFDQSKDSLDETEDTSITTTDFSVDPFDRSLPRLEDIEEEGSLKNSPKSVLSLEMGSLEDRNGFSNNGNGNGNGEKGRPASRESSSSLNEFERLESALLLEYQDKREEPALSEIEEGHESQVSEESDETEMCGEPDPYDADEDNDDKMMKIFSEKFEIVEDSPEITEVPEYAEEGVDPMIYFSTTVMEPRSPEANTNTDTSQWDDFTQPKSSEIVGTTSADSSLEFRMPDRYTARYPAASLSLELDSSSAAHPSPGSHKGRYSDGLCKMTSSGDSLEDPQIVMEVSRDSLDLEEIEVDPPTVPQPLDQHSLPSGSVSRNEMFDSLTGSLPGAVSQVMTDSLELQTGQPLPCFSRQHIMEESLDSLTGKSREERSSGDTGVTAEMITSTDSFEGQGFISSSATSTTADAAMWSSGTGSAATLVSSQEDLTLENQFSS
ncbi:unnamed protein product [Allacma fusca]|uniref:Uncharacterized protein n=1 Tax=Allacma fusca TaxID=39272 RepID=A0A8J2JP58_9HEXA|nr:unnamed protein product [Allacma fusca]